MAIWNEVEAASRAVPKEAFGMLCGKVTVQLVELPEGLTAKGLEFRLVNVKSEALSELQFNATVDDTTNRTFDWVLDVDGTFILMPNTLPLIATFDCEISELAVPGVGKVRSAGLPIRSVKVLEPAVKLEVET